MLEICSFVYGWLKMKYWLYNYAYKHSFATLSTHIPFPRHIFNITPHNLRLILLLYNALVHHVLLWWYDASWIVWFTTSRFFSSLVFFSSRNLIKLSPLCQCATHSLQKFYLLPWNSFFILQLIFSLLHFFPLIFHFYILKCSFMKSRWHYNQ